jgi:hypothetical protein
VAYHERSDCCAYSQQHESIFLAFVIWIFDQERSLVIKYGLRFFKRNSVLAPIRRGLARFPFKSQFRYKESVATM